MASMMGPQQPATVLPTHAHSSSQDIMVPDLHLGSFTTLALADFNQNDSRYPSHSVQRSTSRRPISAAVPSHVVDAMQNYDFDAASTAPRRQDTADSAFTNTPVVDPTLAQDADGPAAGSHDRPSTLSAAQLPPTSSPDALVGADHLRSPSVSTPNYSALPPGAAPASAFGAGPMAHALRGASIGSASAGLATGPMPKLSPEPSTASSPSVRGPLPPLPLSASPPPALPTPPPSHRTPSDQPSPRVQEFPQASPRDNISRERTPSRDKEKLSLERPLSGDGGPRHPAIVSVRASTSAKRTTPTPASSAPRGGFAASPTYPSIINAVAGSPYSLQDLIASESPAALKPLRKKVPEEEVCVECMMRDQDMADVDATSPGVWARESDADYLDLIRREKEEEERHSQGQSSSSSGHGSRPRVRSRGGRLTEENLRKWLLMNPKDHESRWRTITKYVKAQSALLEAEMAARLRVEAESRAVDYRVRDAVAQLRRSTHNVSPEDGGVRIKIPATPSMPTTNYFGQQYEADSESLPATPGRVLASAEDREVVLLQNGMMLERLDVQPQHGRGRSVSQPRRSEADERMSMYSSPSAPSRRALSPVSGYGVPRAQSQYSMDSQAKKGRFFGFRTSMAGSMVSLGASRASVVNLHGVDLERERSRGVAMSTPTLNDLQREWPAQEPPHAMQQVEMTPKKKKKGLGRIWKILTGSKRQSEDKSQPRPVQQTRPEEDLSMPLAPPPPLTYLMGERQAPPVHGRGFSTASLPSLSSQPRSMTSPVPALQIGPSPPTAPSSILPSPTSIRYSWRDSNVSFDQQPVHPGVAKDRLEFPSLDDGAAFEAEVHRRQLQPPPVLNGPRAGNSSNARPHTVFMTEKSLPPLPPEAGPRPATSQGLLSFRSDGARRKSFAGMTEPHHPPVAHTRGATLGPAMGQHSLADVNEFGEAPQAKRRSRFGLSSLLGRKQSVDALSVKGRRPSTDVGKSSMSGASSAQGQGRPIAQDEQFVAYRYPTGNELLRQQ